MKYEEWILNWLKSIKPKVKEQTYSKYLSNVRLHILKQLGNFELEELSGEVLEDYALKLCDSKLAPNTIIGILTIVAESLKKAVKVGKLKQDYASFLIYPKVTEKPVECLSMQEQRKIESYILAKDKPKLYGIIICLYTGLRIGELLALTWKDINFNNKTLMVTKSCYDSWNGGKYEKVIDTPKTTSSVRIIPLPQPLLAILKKLKQKSESTFIISNKKNEGVHKRAYQYAYENLLKELNIEHKHFHSLRHTFATRAIECGVDIKTLADLLGHKNPTITLKRYAHCFYNHKILMMNKIAKNLKFE